MANSPDSPVRRWLERYMGRAQEYYRLAIDDPADEEKLLADVTALVEALKASVYGFHLKHDRELTIGPLAECRYPQCGQASEALKPFTTPEES